MSNFQLINTFFDGFQIENLLVWFILVRTCNSFLYLITNTVTHGLGLPYALANIFRLLGSILDLLVLLVLLFNHIFEWCKFAYLGAFMGTFIDIGALLLISASHWVALVQQKERVQPVFIIGVMTMILFLIVSISLFYRGLRIPLPALLLYFGGYSFCWLVFHFYEKQILALAVKAGEKLSWVDPLIGSRPHSDLSLRNACSFNLGLLNLIYICTFTGGVLNIITTTLIGLSLITSVLIGLRLIKMSASVKLKTSFMLQILQQGYSNITTIYGQLKNKQLPPSEQRGMRGSLP